MLADRIDGDAAWVNSPSVGQAFFDGLPRQNEFAIRLNNARERIEESQMVVGVVKCLKEKHCIELLVESLDVIERANSRFNVETRYFCLG